ncbi:hypothetical protein GH714_011741 [Hevea brasiliensis]|uniref:Smr domain-containing protein n=1 Tax=Hevea brasiliensis TaxID=3981 RepID=A0A6A6NGP0_HEVBR|nr:hypothetical protein GH714_011741 [Hevea brasiliensis]
MSSEEEIYRAPIVQLMDGWVGYGIAKAKWEASKRNFPPITKNGNCNKLTPVSDSGLVKVLEEKDFDFAFNHLKELHSWVDERLIQDIMASMNNDIDKATTLLEEKISNGNSMEKWEAKDLSNCDDFRCSRGCCCTQETNSGAVEVLPIELEWESQDVYLSIEHSSKACKEWLDAERLNAKAAKEILSIRNSENDPWTLDLHVLHAAEAVKALQEHLNKIETLLKNQAVSHGPFISIEWRTWINNRQDLGREEHHYK